VTADFSETVLALLREGLGAEDIARELEVDVAAVRVAVGKLREAGRFMFWEKRSPPSQGK
jgi:hypothetical protein